VRGESHTTYHENRLLEIVLRGLHIRKQQESWLICFHEELQSDELVRTITFEEVSTQSHKRQTAERVEFGTPIAIFKFSLLALSYSRKTYIRNRLDGAVNTSRTLLKPASWPSSCHREVVSGMSDAWTCAVIASHSSLV
jgi:hypothetical protein